MHADDRPGGLVSEALETYHKDHWVEIEPERLQKYEALFAMDDARADATLGPVGVQPGETVLDFGCGPGFVAVHLARRVGPDGHVHALDVNADFVDRARQTATNAGLADRITVHHSTDETVSLADGSVDRIYSRNVLEYVPDVHAVLTELARVLRPGGTMVASDSDFGFIVVEPFSPDEIREIFDAAAPAFRDPNIGRKLRAAFGRAGHTDVTVQVATSVDTRGHLRTVIENMLGYGLAFDRMSEERAAYFRERLEAALVDGTFMAVLPQWWVTGTKPT